jgi:TorA-specific chaperone
MKVDLEALLYMRAQIYFLLSRAFERELDKDFFEQLTDYAKLLSDIAKNSEDEAFIVGTNKLNNFISTLRNISFDTALEELACNFATLFLNAAAHTEVKHIYPYASVYLSENHLLYQKETEEVIKFYAQNKIALKKDFKEPEDHIAVELNFIALLTDSALNAFKNKNIDLAVNKISITKGFMENHLLPWVHKLCIDLREDSTDDFYKALADITLGYIRTDYKSLDTLIDMLKQ